LSGAELEDYLKGFYLPDIAVSNVFITDSTLGQNLTEIAANLKLAYQSVEFKLIKSYFELGGLLTIAKARFEERKIVDKINATWKEWVEEKTGMAPSYCRRVIQMFDLTSTYPKLRDLKGITFTELFKLRSAIESSFKDPNIARNWL